MSAIEELADLIRGIDGPSTLGGLEVAEGIIEAGYVRMRTIMSAEDLDSLANGSVVRIADDSDVLLKSRDGHFYNQPGFKVTSALLWQHGAKPLVVLHDPAAQ